MKKKSFWSFDWLSAVCLFVLFMLVSSRLGLTKWADHLDVLGWLLLLGAVLGYILGRWRAHWAIVFPLSFLTGAFFFVLTFVYSLSEKAGFVSRFVDIWTRIDSTFAQLTANVPVTDSILFLLVVGILFWFIGLTTGLSIMRSGRPWIPLLLLGFAILVIEHYQPDPPRAFYSWAYAVVALILLGRLFFLGLRKEITKDEQHIGSDTEFDFNRSVLVMALVIGFTSLIIPRIIHLFIVDSKEQTTFSQKWEIFTRKFENAFYSLDQSQITQEQQIADNFQLGTGQIQGNDPVLYIRTSARISSTFPFYWRGKVYSTYENKTWSIGNSYKQVYLPQQKINSSKVGPGQQSLKIWVQSQLPSLTQVYTTGQVVSFSRSVSAAVLTETIYEKEIMAFFIEPGLNQNEIYRFETVLPVPTGEDLSNAGTDYPTWVTERYLELPDGLSDQMKELATSITTGKGTPFDKAVAVTQYLRTNYEYQPVIPAPPKKADPVEWFLFDYKKGFCNYYASAEVLLLRLAGVPTRLAVGYAQGTPAESGDGFTVQKNDSHAWPEVYFPAYGWIPFEPTASLPVLDWTAKSTSTNPQTGNPSTNPDNPLNQNKPGLTGEDRANLLLEQADAGLDSREAKARKLSLFGKILVIFASLVTGVGLTFVVIKMVKNWAAVKNYTKNEFAIFRRRIFRIPLLGFWLQTIGLSPIERNFSIVEFCLLLLGEKIYPGSTAQELSNKLIKLIPESEAEITALLDQHQLYTYSNQVEINADTRNHAKKVFRQAVALWWQKRTMRVKRFLDRF
jgi:transglutaminase-like putative cysteine protease